ncbi:uncharacterized protein LOC135708076 [Ochlerotatus camptorhynchus]|uniref:uncharacterized protein LOC135708076 n=1 Tax=Ochlerotatus camptorhynchus TaxID=644619 RepID=UPI0031D08313
MSLKTFLIPIVIGLVMALALTIEASPMYYKKVSGQKYEPDWVAVSSTVIPLAEYRVSVGGSGGEQHKSTSLVADDEYRRAYMKHKKLTAANKAKLVTQKGSDATVAQARVQEDPDTLITANKKFYERKSD